MSDPVEQFIAGLASLDAAPDRQGELVVYRTDALDGGHAGESLETAVEIAELVNWPIAPPHWIHLPAAVSFAHTNSQPSPLAGWLRHSRQINGWGTDPNPTQAWLAHVRGVVGEAQ
jgi:hypothetical protein